MRVRDWLAVLLGHSSVVASSVVSAGFSYVSFASTRQA